MMEALESLEQDAIFFDRMAKAELVRLVRWLGVLRATAAVASQPRRRAILPARLRHRIQMVIHETRSVIRAATRMSIDYGEMMAEVEEHVRHLTALRGRAI
jgi:hypothetical protein